MPRDEAYQLAEKKIEEARRSGAKELDLSGRYDGKDKDKLTELPESLGQLTQLQTLNLSGNRLTALPESLGQLTQLQSLHLSNNQLAALPEWLGQLTQLQTLSLSGNQLTALPEWLGQLTQLQTLDLSSNQLTALPEWLGELSELIWLDLRGNRLSCLPKVRLKWKSLTALFIGGVGIGNPIAKLPEWIGFLSQLKVLGLANCELVTLPDSIGNLTALTELWLNNNRLRGLPNTLAQLTLLRDLSLSDNPLNPELAAAQGKGFDAVKRYLREMAKGGRNRYEAKLLILGDGNEGKTCVSRALRGLPFRVQKTTRGVDVVQWTFPHPNDGENREKEITLNIWDFEGQEITHQTHQFFLTSQALYLLVFKCRDQFLMDRAEYWLDTIRARAPQAKVVMVMSQCEERSPHIPLDRIEEQYGGMLAKEWFFAVGCENGKNIDKLQTFLRRSAADLPFMGERWPETYERAETEIKAKAKKNTSHITRARLNGILKKAGVNEDNYDGAAGSMARIGAITQFSDSTDLMDFVVLKPQWLTKAVSKVMEDGKLSEDKGEIALKRMEAIWSKSSYPGMFSTFHNCMKEFELCYDLEGLNESCLVPLRFGYVAPTIPWTPALELKERRMEYKLNVRPPMGIMSRFIVKTHHMIVRTLEHPKGIYWHNGVFLRTNSPWLSEALCQFLPDERIFRVRVRAAFPQNMCEQIHAYIEAVFSFFGGLSAERSYGCIKVDEATGAESQCKGLHTEKRIYTAISKEREMVDCEFEDHEVDPRLLVSGISSFGGFVEERLRLIVREEVKSTTPEWAEPFLRGIGALLDWAEQNSDKLEELLHGQAALAEEFKQEAELKLHEYLGALSLMLDDRDHTAAPGLISIMTKDLSPWSPVNFFKKTYILTPYCECEGNIHACEDGNVEFTKDKMWWKKTAPWLARGTKLLAAGLQLAFAGMPLALGAEVAKSVEAQVKLMDALTKQLELEAPEEESDDGSGELIRSGVGKDLRGKNGETALMRASLARFLEETAPDNYRARKWGSLRRIKMSDNSHRWLCETCAARNR